MQAVLTVDVIVAVLSIQIVVAFGSVDVILKIEAGKKGPGQYFHNERYSVVPRFSLFSNLKYTHKK